ncbi:MAG: biotin--[acetyl-CoA-carboxylase] ligase [Acidobacteriota bacterium]|nr:biotin--[acetyl-CoA-carboxylase] ligase [Acidobacteriota bacterium]
MILHPPPFIIHRFAALGSTNDHLKQMSDAPEFSCVVADEQTTGRGRRDRAWHSAPGEGLYLSLLLRPPMFATKIPLLSLMSAVAVAETLIERGVVGVDIKWPNDVLVNELKLSGILIEAISNTVGSGGIVRNGAGDTRVIVGIGVNLNHPSSLAFPEELRQTATSLRIETGMAIEVDEFRDQLLPRLAHWYECWKRGEERLILDSWQRLSSYSCGQQVAVTLDHEQLIGRTAGLNDDGALLVQTADGSMRTILAGEVTRLRKKL